MHPNFEIDKVNFINTKMSNMNYRGSEMTVLSPESSVHSAPSILTVFCLDDGSIMAVSGKVF